MAVERTGTAVSINTSTASSSQSITVPSDCTCALVFWGGYGSASNDYFDSGEYTLTLGGNSFTHAARSTSVSDSDDVVCAYLVNPPTGSQTLAWTFNSSIDNGFLIGVIFYKGVDTSNPIAASGGADTATTSPLTITGLSSTPGNMTVGAYANDNTGGSLDTNSQTVIVDDLGPAAKSGTVHLAVGEKAASSTFQMTGALYSGMVAVSLAAAAATVTLNQHSFRFFNDDGSESAATVKAAINTNINLSASDVARIRFLIDATGDPTGEQFQLEFRRKPSGGSFGPWTKSSN